MLSLLFSESPGSISPLRVRPTEFGRFGALRCEFEAVEVFAQLHAGHHQLTMLTLLTFMHAPRWGGVDVRSQNCVVGGG